jgi:hypothetical protein
VAAPVSRNGDGAGRLVVGAGQARVLIGAGVDYRAVCGRAANRLADESQNVGDGSIRSGHALARRQLDGGRRELCGGW